MFSFFCILPLNTCFRQVLNSFVLPALSDSQVMSIIYLVFSVFPEDFRIAFRFLNGRSEDILSRSMVNDLQPADRRSFDQLYELYATDVLRVSYYYLGNREQAEDVTQDVFVRLLTNQPDLEYGREKAWLLKVALNRCRDLWRSAWVKRTILGHPGFESFPAPDELNRVTEDLDLADSINRLRPEFKEVILLFYYQGFSVAEIAAILDIAEGTVSSRLSRAREKLQNEYKGDGKL